MNKTVHAGVAALLGLGLGGSAAAQAIDPEKGMSADMVAAAQVPRHPGVRPGARGRAGSPCRTGKPRRVAVPRPDAGKQRRRPDRDHDHRHHPGARRRSCCSNNAGDQIVPAATAAQEAGHPRRHLEFADPVRRRRERVRRPGRFRLDRRRDGRHGPFDSSAARARWRCSPRRPRRPTRTPGSQPWSRPWRIRNTTESNWST